MKHLIFGFIVFSAVTALSPLYALELHNLELILEISDPDTTRGAFGARLSSGDINGDGISDIVVGKNSSDKYGLIFVFYGGNPIDSIPDVTLVGHRFLEYGLHIGIGDVNGDGYDDIITAAGEGCNVYFGGNPMDSLPDLSMEKGLYAGAGDLNSDGYDDWIISQYWINDYAGKVRIYFGSPVPDTIPDIILNGEPASNFGVFLESGYDVNNDGYDDLFISAMAYSDAAATWRGKTYIYYGGSPMDTIPDVEMMGPPREQDFFGVVIALVPDLNNDGFDEAVVGEPLNAVHDTVFVYWGGNPMDNTIDMVFADSGAYFGNAVCGSRKIHPGGGKALIVGAPWYPTSPPKGRVYVYMMGSLMDTIYDALAVGADTQKIGGAVAAVDINGDGTDEVIFSNFFADNTPHKVWVCKYTGPGVEENENLNNLSTTLKASQNPFIKSTILKYSLPSEAKVSLKLYDISGRCVKALVDGENKMPGYYKVSLKAKDFSSGVYFAKFYANGKEKTYKETKKIVLMK